MAHSHRLHRAEIKLADARQLVAAGSRPGDPADLAIVTGPGSCRRRDRGGTGCFLRPGRDTAYRSCASGSSTCGCPWHRRPREVPRGRSRLGRMPVRRGAGPVRGRPVRDRPAAPRAPSSPPPASRTSRPCLDARERSNAASRTSAARRATTEDLASSRGFDQPQPDPGPEGHRSRGVPADDDAISVFLVRLVRNPCSRTPRTGCCSATYGSDSSSGRPGRPDRPQMISHADLLAALPEGRSGSAEPALRRRLGSLPAAPARRPLSPVAAVADPAHGRPRFVTARRDLAGKGFRHAEARSS